MNKIVIFLKIKDLMVILRKKPEKKKHKIPLNYIIRKLLSFLEELCLKERGERLPSSGRRTNGNISFSNDESVDISSLEIPKIGAFFALLLFI